jgi:hypothetical protein
VRNAGFSSGHGFSRAANARTATRLQPLRDAFVTCRAFSKEAQKNMAAVVPAISLASFASSASYASRSHYNP